jgi:N-acetylglucosaminyldiphosphoundecaprenol N-acetyl-beta-D-mannosaminyltransferase
LPDILDRDVYCLLGLPFDAISMEEAQLHVRASARFKRRCFLSTPNLNFVVGCLSDHAFRDSVLTSDLSVADSMPLVWMARLLGLPIRERLSGSDLFEGLRATGAPPLSVYFFGGPPGMAESASLQLQAQRGGLDRAGFDDPGFGSIEAMSCEDRIGRINASGADFLVVALGARKGQAWIERNRDRIAVPVISHLGAVINFVAGAVSRAPVWMRKAGLEWLWRIKEEPSLWRRYTGDGTAFLRLLVTRLLPYAWFLRRLQVEPEELTAAYAKLMDDDDRMVVACHGHWSASNVERLRPTLRQAIASGRDVEVSLVQTKSIDSAVIGLLMLAYGVQRRRGGRFVLNGVTPQLRKVLYWHCAEFLLQDCFALRLDSSARPVELDWTHSIEINRS